MGTQLNTTWVVPSNPIVKYGSNAPGWWYGIQTNNGDGALIQPILAYGYEGPVYTMFNGVFDWTDQSWHTSPQKYTVKPGDTMISSITYVPQNNSYTMYIKSKDTGKSVTTNYKVEKAQKGLEDTAYFVLEHQPAECKAYPKNGVCTFENIYLEVDNNPVKLIAWEAKQENPACDSKTTIIDSNTIKFTWDANSKLKDPELSKWGYGNNGGMEGCMEREKREMERQMERDGGMEGCMLREFEREMEREMERWREERGDEFVF